MSFAPCVNRHQLVDLPADARKKLIDIGQAGNGIGIDGWHGYFLAYYR